MNRERFSRTFFVLFLSVISLLFVLMIRGFLVTILMAALFAGLSAPLYERLVRAFRGRKTAASLTTLFLLLALVVVPLLFLLGMIAGQALSISEKVGPWISARMAEPDLLLERIPWIERFEPYRAPIMSKGAELVGTIGTFLFDSIKSSILSRHICPPVSEPLPMKLNFSWSMSGNRPMMIEFLISRWLPKLPETNS